MIVIHIGTGKTGSTAIQNILTNNRDFLEKKGWLYPKEIGDQGRGHSRLYEDMKKNNFGILKELENEVKKSYLDNLLLSCEGFFKLDEKQISQFVSLLDSLNKGEIKIILYFRRQDERAESSILEAIKQGNINALKNYNFKNDSRNDYYAIVRKWKKFIKKENIIIRPYGKQFLPNKYSLYEGFFNYVFNIDFKDVKNELIIHEGDANPSLDAVSGFVADFFGYMIDDNNKRKVLVSQLLAIQYKYGKSKTYLFGRAERNRILSFYAEDNRALIEEYNVTKKLFELDDNDYNKPTEAEIIERLSIVYKRKNYLMLLEDWYGKNNLLSYKNANKRVFIQGFYNPDKYGVWTKGDKISKLAFLVYRGMYNVNKYINLLVKSKYIERSSTVSFMKIGDGEWMELKKNDQYKISTEEIKKDGGVVFVELKHKNTITSNKLDAKSNNARVMGCYLKSITFEEII